MVQVSFAYSRAVRTVALSFSLVSGRCTDERGRPKAELTFHGDPCILHKPLSLVDFPSCPVLQLFFSSQSNIIIVLIASRHKPA